MAMSEHERMLLVTGTLDTSGVGAGANESLEATSLAFAAPDVPVVELQYDDEPPAAQPVEPEPVEVEPVEVEPVEVVEPVKAAPVQAAAPAKGRTPRRAPAKKTTQRKPQAKSAAR